MIIKEEKMVCVEGVTDVLCDVCGESTIDSENMNWEFSTLSASWGYGSNKDLTKQTCHFCESCHDKVVAFIESLGGKIQEGTYAPYAYPPV